MVNLQEIAEYLYLGRRWFLWQVQHLPVLYCAQKVPLFDLESPKRCSADFFSFCVSLNTCCNHSRVWVPGNLGAQPYIYKLQVKLW